jgi:hypothetical protein
MRGYGANSLKVVDRFLCETQPRISTFPIGDGSNLQNPNNIPAFTGREWSEREWQFRRLFIRALHFPGLLAFDPKKPNSFDASRGNCFLELYIAGRILLELEHNTTTGPPTEYPHNRNDNRWQDMQWIKVSRAIIDTALQAMFTASETPVGPVVDIVAKRTLQGVASPEPMIVYWNMENAPTQMAQAMQQVSGVRGNIL